MSQEFFDPEIMSDFIIEAKEHLETIEPNLLLLEKSPKNVPLLNEIFRPMHSLKGASGFLNLTRINALAHRAENILDELRKGTIAVNSQIMDVILSTTDALRQMIDNLERTNGEGDVDTTPLIEAIDTIMHEALHGKTIASEVVSLPDSAVAANSEELGANEEGTRAVGDVATWLKTLKSKEPYALTAFGEGHLRDFVEEAKENISSLMESLLELEKSPDNDELVNDLFRYFHNLKGNSGIIGYQDLNGLTHEAETLLNSVRKHEYNVSSPLIDILLLTVDVIEELVSRIDVSLGTVSPFDTAELLLKLQQVVAGGAIETPASLMAMNNSGTKNIHEASNNNAVDHASAEDIRIFKETIVQQMSTIEAALAGMRKDGNNHEFSDAMFRSLVTVQNACGFMGFEEIKIYAERTAGIVDKGRSTNIDFSIMADLLEQECAIIHDMIAEQIKLQSKLENINIDSKAIDTPLMVEGNTVSKGNEEKSTVISENALPSAKVYSPTSTTASVAAKVAAKPDEVHARKTSATIRVDHEKLDHLMNLIGELIINRNRYAMLARQLEATGSINEVGQIAQNLTETTYSMARISDDLQATIMKVRMVPVASVFSRFPRLVRDLARKSGKEIELIMEGEDTELDKSVVEEVGDPLVHLIRNAVDHGIEHEDMRVAAGKSKKGNVWLRAYYKGNAVTIEIEDDGKGIEPEAMRKVGIRKGIITPEDAKLLDDREAMELIFAPGFSSAEVITDISGRGVGMDVVRTNIKALKGSIAITSEVGKGTKFTLSLPLTLAIIDALMVEVADEVFAIPLDVVSETTKIEAHLLTDIKGRKAVTLRGEVLGVVRLSDVLGLPASEADPSVLSIVIIQDNERQLGLVVDRMLERQEIVIKPLGEYLGDIRGISGATIMGDGSVILILDPQEVYALAIARS